MINWIFPLTILPGIGLLIMSTTNWAVALTGEINRLFEQSDCNRMLLRLKIAQLGLINRALVALYFSVATCAVGACIGAFNYENGQEASIDWVVIMISIGIISLLAATIMLIVYAFRAVNIKQRQFSERL